MAITLQTIFDRMDRRLHDVNDVSADMLYDWSTDLNQFLYTEMFGMDPERFIVEQTYTVTGPVPSTQLLPVAFRDIQESGTGFFIRNNAGYNTVEKLVMTSFGSNQRGYYITGGNVIFTGFGAATFTIVLRYIPTLADMTTMASTFIVPDENKELVTLGMILYYYRAEEDMQQVVAEQDFLNALGRFLDKLKKSPKIFAMTTSINSGA